MYPCKARHVNWRGFRDHHRPSPPLLQELFPTDSCREQGYRVFARMVPVLQGPPSLIRAANGYCNVMAAAAEELERPSTEAAFHPPRTQTSDTFLE